MTWFSRKALSALMPPCGDLVGVADTGLDAFLRQYKREAPMLLRVGLAASTFLFHAAPITTVFVPLPAFWLPEKLLAKHATKMAMHPLYPIRMSTFTLKMVGGLCWGADPKVREALGLAALGPDPGPWVEGS
jgi:hypothetical protein